MKDHWIRQQILDPLFLKLYMLYNSKMALEQAEDHVILTRTDRDMI